MIFSPTKLKLSVGSTKNLIGLISYRQKVHESFGQKRKKNKWHIFDIQVVMRKLYSLLC